MVNLPAEAQLKGNKLDCNIIMSCRPNYWCNLCRVFYIFAVNSIKQMRFTNLKSKLIELGGTMQLHLEAKLCEQWKAIKEQRGNSDQIFSQKNFGTSILVP